MAQVSEPPHVVVISLRHIIATTRDLNNVEVIMFGRFQAEVVTE